MCLNLLGNYGTFHCKINQSSRFSFNLEVYHIRQIRAHASIRTHRVIYGLFNHFHSGCL